MSSAGYRDVLWEDVRGPAGTKVAFDEPLEVPPPHPEHPSCHMGTQHPVPAASATTSSQPQPLKAPKMLHFRAPRLLIRKQTPGSSPLPALGASSRLVCHMWRELHWPPCAPQPPGTSPGVGCLMHRTGAQAPPANIGHVTAGAQRLPPSRWPNSSRRHLR